MLRIIGESYYLSIKIVNRFLFEPIKKSMFAECGKNVRIGRNSSMTYKNIYIGDDVSIGENCRIMTSDAKVFLKGKIMLAPNVTIITGDHRIDLVGSYMCEVQNKLECNDADVVIERDVWIGANTTILKGVHIGRGSVIAAGSVVTRNVEEFSIVAGVPAKFIRMRFDNMELNEHLRLLETKI